MLSLIARAWSHPLNMSTLRSRALSRRLSISQTDSASIEEIIGDYTPVWSVATHITNTCLWASAHRQALCMEHFFCMCKRR